MDDKKEFESVSELTLRLLEKNRLEVQKITNEAIKSNSAAALNEAMRQASMDKFKGIQKDLLAVKSQDLEEARAILLQDRYSVSEAFKNERYSSVVSSADLFKNSLVRLRRKIQWDKLDSLKSAGVRDAFHELQNSISTLEGVDFELDCTSHISKIFELGILIGQLNQLFESNELLDMYTNEFSDALKEEQEARSASNAVSKQNSFNRQGDTEKKLALLEGLKNISTEMNGAPTKGKLEQVLKQYPDGYKTNDSRCPLIWRGRHGGEGTVRLFFSYRIEGKSDVEEGNISFETYRTEYLPELKKEK